jgi:glucuronosyltransferase
MSQIFRDRPQTAMETAIFWTEYVIRHKGAPHLRSAAVDLPWYQYLLLDVQIFLVLIVITSYLILHLAFKKLFTFLLRCTTNTEITKATKLFKSQ